MSSSVLRLLAFGASLTEGYYADGTQFHPYTHRLAQLFRSASKPIDIVNAGVSGEAVLSETMLPRLKSILSSSKEKFDWICLLAGTNDTMRDQVPGRKVFDGYQLLINECHRHQAKILSMTLPETEWPRDSPYDQHRQVFNQLIRDELIKVNPEKKIVVLDLDRLLPRHGLTPEQRRELWDDGVHLTPNGYNYLADLIYQALQMHLVEN